jgi:UDP-N-acetylglucosamine--N-acetylmuramyl-(pentapeptide) pyrophosphoryl-undecaprenol N-acetylglucosamine transferase
MKTLLIMAGGTGGHVMPALAVAEQLRGRGVNIVWMGTENGIEHKLVPDAGFDLRLVNVKGIRGSGLWRKLSAPFLLIGAALQAMNIILNCKANAILGMGGYVSGPGGIMGRLLLKPLLLHEQNAVAGTTNKILAPFAKRIMTGFERVQGLRNAHYIGNPVRSEIVSIQAPENRLAKDSSDFRILLIGGSQGAQVFNQSLPDLLKGLQRRLGDEIKISIRHQCGRNNTDDVTSRYIESGLDFEVHEFIEDMATAYAISDLVICRSGAMTVSEVAAAGAVALFVPLPFAIDDHQFYNAKVMSDSSAAMCFRQERFVSGDWIDDVVALATDRRLLIAMAIKARIHARPNATREAAEICLEVLNA